MSSTQNGKILIISNSGKGLYSFRRELIEKLVNMDYEVLLSYPLGDKADEFRNIGCKYRRIDFDSASTNPLHDIKLFFSYIKLLQIEKVDIILAYTIKPCIYGGMASRILGVPMIASITGISPAIANNQGLVQKLTILLCKIGLKKAERIFFQNEMNLNMFKELNIVNDRYELTCGSGVNLRQHKLEPYPPNDDIVVITFVGRLLRIKGVEELCEALLNLKGKYKNLRCVFVGDKSEDDLPFFDKACDGEYVSWLGYIEDIHTHLAKCHALIMPSYAEGMSNVMLEAAACGRPVLGSNVPGCIEIFSEGITGFGFEPRNVGSLTQAIEKFMSLSHSEKEIMGINGNIKVTNEFNRDKVIRTYINEIKRIIEKD